MLRNNCQPVMNIPCSEMTNLGCGVLPDQPIQGYEWYFNNNQCLAVPPSCIPSSAETFNTGYECCINYSRTCPQSKKSKSTCFHRIHPDGKGFTLTCRKV